MTASGSIITAGLSTVAQIKAQSDDILVLQTHDLIPSQDTGSNEGQNWKQIEREADGSEQPVAASYGQFNLGLHVGDDAEQVHRHRCELLSAINSHLMADSDTQGLPDDSPLQQLHWLNQVHGNKVLRVEGSLTMQVQDADAIVTSLPHCGLAIMTADCVPIVLYQPSSGQIGAIHAGWQGLANGVIKATLATFKEPGEIKAWIGACISQANYEVGGEVVDKLVNGCLTRQLVGTIAEPKLRQLISRDQRIAESDLSITIANEGSNSDHKQWLDLPKLASIQLQALGIKVVPDNIIDCSYSDHRYYSYRRQTHQKRPATGRMALVIMRRA